MQCSQTAICNSINPTKKRKLAKITMSAEESKEMRDYLELRGNIKRLKLSSEFESSQVAQMRQEFSRSSKQNVPEAPNQAEPEVHKSPSQSDMKEPIDRPSSLDEPQDVDGYLNFKAS